jgi:hypothetical protein
MAYQLAYYKALLKIWGAPKFDTIFGENKNQPMFALETSATKLQPFVEYTLISARSLDVGNNFYIHNHILYTYKDKNGEAKGFNLLVMENNGVDEPKFIGFGLNPDGLTAREIREELINQFNQTPFNSRIVSQKKWQEIKPTDFQDLLMEFLKEQQINSTDDEEIFEKIKIFITVTLAPKGGNINLYNQLIENINQLSEEGESGIVPHLSLSRVVRF